MSDIKVFRLFDDAVTELEGHSAEVDKSPTAPYRKTSGDYPRRPDRYR